MRAGLSLGVDRGVRRGWSPHPHIGDVSYEDVLNEKDPQKKAEDAVKYATKKAEDVGEDIEIGASAGTAIGTAIFPGIGTAVGGVIGTVAGALYAFRDEIGDAWTSLTKSNDQICMEKYKTHYDESSKTCGGSAFKVSPDDLRRMDQLRREQQAQFDATDRARMLVEAAEGIAKGFAYKPYQLVPPAGIHYLDENMVERVTDGKNPLSRSDWETDNTPGHTRANNELHDWRDRYQLSDDYQSSGVQDGTPYTSYESGRIQKNRPIIKAGPALLFGRRTLDQARAHHAELERLLPRMKVSTASTLDQARAHHAAILAAFGRPVTITPSSGPIAVKSSIAMVKAAPAKPIPAPVKVVGGLGLAAAIGWGLLRFLGR